MVKDAKCEKWLLKSWHRGKKDCDDPALYQNRKTKRAKYSVIQKALLRDQGCDVQIPSIKSEFSNQALEA